MKENLHNQSQGSEVIAEGGAGDDVEKNNEKSTGYDNRLTQRREEREELLAALGLSKLREGYR